jgi:hypothetical protein
MAVAKETMTDEQRRSVAIEYLKAFDNGGTTSTGGSIIYLDPDYAGLDTDRYPWLSADGRDPSRPLG